MKAYMNFSISELKGVAYSLKEIQQSLGAKLGQETMRLLQTIRSKRSHKNLSLKIDNLEKLSMEFHTLEVSYGINLGQRIYHFMHSFHRN